MRLLEENHTCNKRKKWVICISSKFKILATEDIIEKMKRQPIEWEKIFANQMSDKGLVFGILKNNSHNSTTKRQPNFKNWP